MALFGGAKKNATKEFKVLVWPVLTHHKEVGIRQKTFLTDPFVYGYLWGAWSGFKEAPPCAQLTKRQQVGIMLEVDEMIQPSWPGILVFIQHALFPMPFKKYQKEENPDWKRGIANGRTYARWVYGVGDIAHDPDVQEAVNSAKILNTTIGGKGEITIKDPTHEQVTEWLFRHTFEEVVIDRFKKQAA